MCRSFPTINYLDFVVQQDTIQSKRVLSTLIPLMKLYLCWISDMVRDLAIMGSPTYLLPIWNIAER